MFFGLSWMSRMEISLRYFPSWLTAHARTFKHYICAHVCVCVLPNSHLICEHYNAVCDGAARCRDRVRSHNRAYLSTCRQRGTGHKMTISKNSMHLQMKQNKGKEAQIGNKSVKLLLLEEILTENEVRRSRRSVCVFFYYKCVHVCHIS